MSAVLATAIAGDVDAALNENRAAEFLGISKRTLQAWRVRGGGPRYCKFGRSVRYRRRELAEFQRVRTFGSTSEADEAIRKALCA